MHKPGERVSKRQLRPQENEEESIIPEENEESNRPEKIQNEEC